MTFDQSKHPRGLYPSDSGQFPLPARDESTIALGAGGWPDHDHRVVPWVARTRASAREDRMLTAITVSMPPLIAGLEYVVPPRLVADVEEAARSITDLDARSGDRLASLGAFLIRTESVSSSKIEYIDASIEDLARAMAGSKANDSATSMLSAASAISEMVDDAGRRRIIDLGTMLTAHKRLMKDDPLDGPFAGRLRQVQNWIGGNNASPIGAVHVPPPPEYVPGYMSDLLQFANRDDVPVIAQAAIVHAQFESIHPFTDGNGRIGRALINAVFRRRNLTRTTITPIASALIARREHYFDLINSYRDGQLDPFVHSLAFSARVASAASADSATVLRELPDYWASLSKSRAGSTASSLIGMLLDQPVLSANAAQTLTGASATSVGAAMDALERDGIVREITGRKRDRVWAATEVMAELDKLTQAIARAVIAAGPKMP